MKTLKIYSKEYQLPSCWSEMSRSQYVQCSWIRADYLGEVDEKALNAARIMAFKALTGVPISVIEQITAAQWADILPHMNFFFKVPFLEENPLPILLEDGVFSQQLHGPTKLLRESSIFEMVSADTAFVNGSQKMDVSKLYELVAILYRPMRSDLKEFKASQDWNGDVREPFNIDRAMERSKLYEKHIPFHLAVGVWLYYWSFREHKLMKFKYVFSKSKGKSVGPNLGWAGTLLEMSGKQFGDFKETGKQNWLPVIMELDRQIAIQKEISEK